MIKWEEEEYWKKWESLEEYSFSLWNFTLNFWVLRLIFKNITLLNLQAFMWPTFPNTSIIQFQLNNTLSGCLLNLHLHANASYTTRGPKKGKRERERSQHSWLTAAQVSRIIINKFSWSYQKQISNSSVNIHLRVCYF